MREIKFKAWDKDEHKWVSENVLYDFLGELGSDNDHIDFLQYTGIKDKNGVEIYEGYIVKVTRKDGCFGRGYYTEIEVIEQPEYIELLDIVSGGPDGTDFVKEIEIIGNIYENPELATDYNNTTNNS